MYMQRDIETNDDGELVLDKGDLKLATAYRSIAQSTLFMAMTDIGGYVPDPEFGANLGTFFGKLSNPTTWADMERSVRGGIIQQAILTGDTYQITVVPVDTETALVMLRLQIVTDEELESDDEPQSVTYGFKFPFMTGELEVISS